jgi:predicted small integral membrane protein
MTSSFAAPPVARHISRLRLLKAVMVLSIGLWALLIGCDNVLDYRSNWQFVQHVLSMDTVFKDNPLRYRAITDATLQTVAYGLIILVQLTAGTTCCAGAVQLAQGRCVPHAYGAARTLSAAGLVLVFLLYFVGFVAVGGEWFGMWQSSIWNGQAKAVMFITCDMFVLVVLLQPEQT